MKEIALTIAGFDPSSGAGITADLAVMQAHGLFGTSCITALTVQSTVGVKSWQPVASELVRQTLACLDEDLPPTGIKIAMLANADTARVVAEYVSRLPSSVPVVLDPVVQSSSGRFLLEPDGLAVVRDQLLSRVGWITPNLGELSILSEMRVEEREQVEEAAEVLAQRYPGLSIAATGGHLPQPEDYILPSGKAAVWLPGQRVETDATHGTGCAFSTALLCGLIRGQEGAVAAANAKAYVIGAMQHATRFGKGKGPMNLLWNLSARSGLF